MGESITPGENPEASHGMTEHFGSNYAAMFREAQAETGKPVYEVGEQVEVERSSGAVEHDWSYVDVVRDRNGDERVLVTKPDENGGSQTKLIPIHEFLGRNPRR